MTSVLMVTIMMVVSIIGSTGRYDYALGVVVLCYLWYQAGKDSAK